MFIETVTFTTGRQSRNTGSFKLTDLLGAGKPLKHFASENVGTVKCWMGFEKEDGDDDAFYLPCC